MKLNQFVEGMKIDYLTVWREYPATLVWTCVVSFLVGAVVF